MAYTPVATDATQPTDDQWASSAALEFRTIKAYLNSIVAAGLPPFTAGGILQTDGVSAFWGPVGDMYSFLNRT